MLGLLRTLGIWIRASRAPSIKFGQGPDWLPPVLGPADWSETLIRNAADCGGNWYFERRAAGEIPTGNDSGQTIDRPDAKSSVGRACPILLDQPDT
jgi:hypothetical protein